MDLHSKCNPPIGPMWQLSLHAVNLSFDNSLEPSTLRQGSVRGIKFVPGSSR